VDKSLDGPQSLYYYHYYTQRVSDLTLQWDKCYSLKAWVSAIWRIPCHVTSTLAGGSVLTNDWQAANVLQTDSNKKKKAVKCLEAQI
jgi:hypothetical protein